MSLLFASTFTVLTLCSPQDPQTAIIQLPDAQEVTGSMLFDVDGDALPDLVLACRHSKTGQRSLRTHLRQKKGPAFSSTPSLPAYDVERDAIAFTFCDCQPAIGSELILLTAERFIAVVTGDDGARNYLELARHQLLWPAADQDQIVPLPDAPVDFDGDGRMDLLLPRPDGWSVCYQDRDGSQPSFARRSELQLPSWRNRISEAVGGRSSGGGNSIAMRFGGGKGNQDAGPLVRSATRSPQCQALDLDGNGKLDLAMIRNNGMHAAMQMTTGTLTAQVRALPLPENRLKVLDPAFNVQWPDVNGDRRADLLLVTSAQRDGDVEARIDLFLAADDGSWPDKYNARLRMQTLANAPQLVDADGDGKDDLVCITLRTSAMANLTNPLGGSFEAQLTIYGNSGKQFETPSLLSQPLPLATDKRLKKPFLLVRPGRRGRPGDVLLHMDGHLERRFLILKNKELQLAASDARTPVPDDARLIVADRIGDDILIVTEREVRHVRFRR